MAEDQPLEHTPREIVDVDTIRNLDTARMALRWALERLHKETEQRHQAEDKAKAAEKSLQRSVEEQAALQRTLALRSGEADERELYYRRLEEFLSLRLEGKLDPAALAHKELEVDQLKRLLDQKLAQNEKELAARRAALERETRHAQEEAERSVRDRIRAVEQGAEIKSRALEQEHLAKMSELREKELLLRQEEKALAERQAHFEDYYATQRAELQAQLKSYREEVDAQVDFRVKLAERALEERQASVEQVWTREKALLLRELEGWKQRVQEAVPRLADLERRLAEAHERATQARVALDAQTALLEEQRRGHEAQAAMWEKDRAALAAQRDDWKDRAERHLRAAHELDKRVAVLEEQAHLSRAAADREIAAIEERKLDTQRRIEALQQEISDWKLRHQEALAKAFEHERALAQANETMERADARAAREITRFEEERRSWEAERSAFAAEVAQLREKAKAALPRLLELERSLALAEEASAQVQAAGDRQAARFDEQRRAWERERRELLARLEPPSGPDPD